MRILKLALVLLAAMAPTMCLAQSKSPDPDTILSAAQESPETVLFRQDFESGSPQMEEWYAGAVPHKITSSGVTTEQARTGKQSYKIVIQFEPGRWGNSYIRLPIEMPKWSDLKMDMWVKISSEPTNKIWEFHGMGWGDLEENVSGNVQQGASVGEENGWQHWSCTAKGGTSVAQYISGASLYLQLADNSPATTVTIYVDDINITGKLPANWEAQWAAVKRYYTVEKQAEIRSEARRRLVDARTWAKQVEESLPPLLEVAEASLVWDQITGLVGKAGEDLAAARPMLAAADNAVADESKPYDTSLTNKPERLVMSARRYVNLARAGEVYARGDSGGDIVPFTLDITQSYPILPTGPMAQNAELSYYDWNEAGAGLENPQILPDSDPVPAVASNSLKGFGCRGTFVPFSFALRTSVELPGLTVTASDLKSKSGVIRNDAVDIRVVQPWFRPFGKKPRLMNELLLHDPSFAEPVYAEQKNKYRDPKVGDDTAMLQPITIPANTNRQFYALVRIPDKAAAGVYKGTIVAKAANGKSVAWTVELEVMPFKLEPTPYAYSAFYRSYIADEATKKQEGIHSWRKTYAQMAAELKSMGEHGFNTLNFYGGTPKKIDNVWDFTELGIVLTSARQAGLTRSPFTWLGHNVFFIPDPREGAPHNWDELTPSINERVKAANDFCKKNGFPKPAFFGHDEATGEKLMELRKGYDAVNKAGGIVTVACSPNYFSEIGSALSLPIVYGGAQALGGERSIRLSRKLGYECWIYNTPSTNMPASPSVYRRRYGLAMWKNGEQGAAPWEYSGCPAVDADPAYQFDYEKWPCYAFAFPTWSGRPIDTIIYEAYREAIYDTRYLATLRKAIKQAKSKSGALKLALEAEKWLANLSVHDDLQQVRRKMADYTVKLGKAAR